MSNRDKKTNSDVDVPFRRFCQLAALLIAAALACVALVWKAVA